MGMCINVRICVYVHIYLHTYMYIHIYICIQKNMFICLILLLEVYDK
jgi:hypothetical protein